jgi:5-methylcytosine-specific restriction endonuclease McrA
VTVTTEALRAAWTRSLMAQLQRTIVEAARLLGYRVQHARPARTQRGWRTPIEGDVGFTDLVLAKPRRRCFAFDRATSRGRALAAARDARRRGAAPAEIFDPFVIYDRDGWLCFCGGPLNRQPTLDSPRNRPHDPTLDHIVPCEDGGEHSRANVRAAHRGCNAKRAHEERRRRRQKGAA